MENKVEKIEQLHFKISAPCLQMMMLDVSSFRS